jgi:hypothetical protein
MYIQFEKGNAFYVYNVLKNSSIFTLNKYKYEMVRIYSLFIQ